MGWREAVLWYAAVGLASATVWALATEIQLRKRMKSVWDDPLAFGVFVGLVITLWPLVWVWLMLSLSSRDSK